MTPHLTLADDCERLLREIADDGPLAMDELELRTGLTIGAINAALCQLHIAGRVVPVKVRRGRERIIRYAIKENPREPLP